MKSLESFSYGRPEVAEDRRRAFTATLPANISGVDELMQALYDRLNLPGYFGFNWNALSDTLRDLHWVEQQDVVLIHEDIPALNEHDLKMYIEVLDQAVRDWKPDEEHRLIVFFPEPAREMIRSTFSMRAPTGRQ